MSLRLALLTGILSATTCDTSFATDSPWFVGASGYRSDHDDFVADTHSSWTLSGGRMLGNYFFVSASYNDFGSFAYRNIPALAGPTFVRIQSIGAAAGVRLPVFSTGFSLNVTAGPHRWDRSFEVRRNSGTESFGVSERGTDLWYSAGVTYAVSSHLSVGASWARYKFNDSGSRLTQRGLGVQLFF
ncbi:MAG: porin family protein [Proteobacteria bacterium]|nr:porin family protein [Pseudomonadota bacterium]